MLKLLKIKLVIVKPNKLNKIIIVITIEQVDNILCSSFYPLSVIILSFYYCFVNSQNAQLLSFRKELFCAGLFIFPLDNCHTNMV